MSFYEWNSEEQSHTGSFRKLQFVFWKVAFKTRKRQHLLDTGHVCLRQGHIFYVSLVIKHNRTTANWMLAEVLLRCWCMMSVLVRWSLPWACQHGTKLPDLKHNHDGFSTDGCMSSYNIYIFFAVFWRGLLFDRSKQSWQKMWNGAIYVSVQITLQTVLSADAPALTLSVTGGWRKYRKEGLGNVKTNCVHDFSLME